MKEAWIATGYEQIRYALRIESVTHTGVGGCGIIHAVRGKCWMPNNAKSNSVRSISGRTGSSYAFGASCKESWDTMHPNKVEW
jgi:hypothetical protein